MNSLLATPVLASATRVRVSLAGVVWILVSAIAPGLADDSAARSDHAPAPHVSSEAHVATPLTQSPAAPAETPASAAQKFRANLTTNRSPVQAIPTLTLGFNLTNSTSTLTEGVTNTSTLTNLSATVLADMRLRLDVARYLRNTRRGADALPLLVELLSDKSPASIRKAALLELAAGAEDEPNSARAQQIYSQYLHKWPDDQYVPEVYLRQGQVFREQGLNKLALAKFYAVMTSALVLKHDQFDYYARLVIEAQIEIAETHFRLEKFVEAGDFFLRLMKQESPFINKADAQFKLVTCLVNTGRFEEAVTRGQDFLTRYPNSVQQPEVRFHLASALKQLGRNNEALAQVLALLREQSARSSAQPETWSYWQQRTGNLIANQLFREGDFTRALEIYLGLVRLDRSPTWQLPVYYQIGMTYERLWQPQKAIETYTDIVNREKEINASPGLKAIIEMARWRIGFVQWQNKAEGFTRSFSTTNAPAIASAPLATTDSK